MKYSIKCAFTHIIPQATEQSVKYKTYIYMKTLIFCKYLKIIYFKIKNALTHDLNTPLLW